jgi:hypothetical protein
MYWVRQNEKYLIQFLGPHWEHECLVAGVVDEVETVLKPLMGFDERSDHIQAEQRPRFHWHLDWFHWRLRLFGYFALFRTRALGQFFLQPLLHPPEMVPLMEKGPVFVNRPCVAELFDVQLLKNSTQVLHLQLGPKWFH